MSTPAEIIKARLEQESWIWPIAIAAMPDGEGVPNNQLCIYDTSGEKIGRLANLRNQFKHGFQVKARAVSYADADAQIDAICALLAGVHMEEILVSSSEGSTMIELVTQTGTPMSMGQDPKRRALISANFLVTFLNPEGEDQ